MLEWGIEQGCVTPLETPTPYLTAAAQQSDLRPSPRMRGRGEFANLGFLRVRSIARTPN